MKKSLLLLTLVPFLLVGCGDKKENTPSEEGGKGDKEEIYSLDLKVVTPAGSPATAFYRYLGDEDHLEVNGNANNVLAYFTSTDTSQKKDIIVAPTNAGIANINNGADFKIAATLTFGNFFVISTGKDADGTLNEGDKVIAFQQNGVAGKLFNYVYGSLGLDVTYLADAAAVKNELLTNSSLEAGYALLAQPVVSAVIGQKKDFKIYANVQKDYKEKSGDKEITQASLFVRNGTDETKVKKLLKQIKNDIDDLLLDPTILAVRTSDIEDPIFATKMSGSKTLITNLIANGNQIGIGYKDAFTNKASIDAFINTLGLKETNEEIYFRTDK